MFVKEQGEGLAIACRSFPSLIPFTVAFGLLVWSTGLAPNPLIQSITEVSKDSKPRRYDVNNVPSWFCFTHSNISFNSLMTDEHLNVIRTDGTTDYDVWAIGDAARVRNMPLPATAQGELPLLNARCT